ncbi:MAG TPA: hypothetical protein PK762_09255 [Candidatus Kapabacteria bacterium]|nr:hypothetical protein [Candidatus Kapabacteria bacterium]
MRFDLSGVLVVGCRLSAIGSYGITNNELLKKHKSTNGLALGC